jgi:hypothetical protein
MFRLLSYASLVNERLFIVGAWHPLIFQSHLLSFPSVSRRACIHKKAKGLNSITLKIDIFHAISLSIFARKSL